MPVTDFELSGARTTYAPGSWKLYGHGLNHRVWVCRACGAQVHPAFNEAFVTAAKVDNHYFNDCSFFKPSAERTIMTPSPTTPPTFNGNIHDWGKPVGSPSQWHCQCGEVLATQLVAEVKKHYETSCSLFANQSDAAKKAAPRPRTCWDTIEIVLPHAKRSLLYGPPGTGKTHAGVYYGLGESQEVYSIYITEYTAVSEPRGNIFPVVRDGQRIYEWQDGPATLAYRHGHRLVINEIDKASDDCMTFFLALLDDAAVSRITLPTGEVVPRHPNFTCVATMNARPIALIDPLRDRFPVTINVDIVNPRAVEALPEAMREIASSTANDQVLEDRLGIRSWLEFVHLREHIDEGVAAAILFGKKASQVLTAVRAKEASLLARDKESAGGKARASAKAATAAVSA